ncbi:DUF3089 domain-containing protein [Rhodococcus sp. B10]|uniref:DUF3089 domain-containing protein n=1 Tax=Rhodococcus sp. B10 TaxID=2695876 RepID=UPI0014313A6E|nr:DUF3089 domain-containing protein [Rhodococcus sp. B10]NIL74528.1 hypothetical protein [Rhodococcus sp. B10]
MGIVRSLGIVVAATAAIAAVTTGSASADESPTVWLCKPGSVPNPCGGSQETYVAASKSVEAGPAPSDPPIDCFYVYPTVSLDPALNADRSVGVEERFIAQQQVERFSPHCRVFAPVYRQSTLLGLATSAGDARAAALSEAYGDIERAWDEYSTRYNDGRGVVLIGHSQGTYMLRALIRQHVDHDDDARSRIVSALLIGGNVLVERGSNVGGDFENLPGCTSADHIGCVVAYSAFDDVPPADARFGRSPSADNYGSALDLPYGPDYEVLCTNPASLQDNSRAPLQTVLRSAAVVPGAPAVVVNANALVAPAPFVIPAQNYTARCESDGDARVLRIEGGDSAELRALPTAGWGLHLQDVNLALGDLTDLVEGQTSTYLAQR